MSHKDDVIQDIIALLKHNGISLNELALAMADTNSQAEKTSASVMSKLFGYLGGIFVFSGICVFISMYWDDFGSVARVIVTLGAGFIVFIMALVCLGDRRYVRAATPLFLIAALLQPSGIIIMLNEYSAGGDPRHGSLFMAAYMIIQQGAAFWSKQRTVLAFTSIFFSGILFATLCDLLEINGKLSGTVIGASLLCIAYALNRSRHQAIAPFWFFTGSFLLLLATFDGVKDTPFELVFLGLCALLIFFSTVIRSRTLLFCGTIAMLSYIGYFTAKHFADTVGWPITLVIIGIALIALSSFAIKLNSKYIKS